MVQPEANVLVNCYVEEDLEEEQEDEEKSEEYEEVEEDEKVEEKTEDKEVEDKETWAFPLVLASLQVPAGALHCTALH